MKRLEKNLSKDYRPLKLFLGDLREIVKVIEDNAGEVILRTEDFEYRSVDDLCSNETAKTQLRSLTIETKGVIPNVVIRLSRKNASLFIGSDTIVAQGIFSTIDSLLVRCFRKSNWIDSHAPHVLIITASLVFWIGSYNRQLAALPVLVLLVVMPWLSWLATDRHAVVILQLRSDSPNFFKRKKDSIILLFIGAVLGALVSAVFTWVSSTFAK